MTLKPLWTTDSDAPSLPVFSGNAHADVAIIGGGITGLTAALLLQRGGKKVVVLEKERIADGESGATTAHITQAIDARYHKVTRTFGADAARAVANATGQAIETIERLVRELVIDCGFRRLPGFLYTEKRNRVAELKAEAASARDAGVDASWATDVPLPFPTRGGVRFENQAQFHPRRYLRGLAGALAGSVFEHSPASVVDASRVETAQGALTADAIVIATNSPIDDFLLHMRIVPARTYAIALELEPETNIDGLFWDTADPYHYTRVHETERGRYLIIGGEDHQVGDKVEAESRFERLRDYVLGRYGDLPLACRWSGQIIESTDGLPFFGRVNDTTFVATGYSGQGITMGTAAALAIASEIEGRESSWAQVFKPSRLKLSSVGIDDRVPDDDHRRL